MKLTDWQDRYILQAFWTQNLRKFVFSKICAKPGASILDVGSGTGALFPDFLSHGFEITAIDIDLDRCVFSKPLSESANILCGDASVIPLAANVFDISVCHYLLLWLKQPRLAVEEMVRVTKPGGTVIAFAEPDYTSRIDHPEIFAQIGQLQSKSLAFQGVNLSMGRQLGGLFRKSGLKDVHLGLLAGEWKAPTEEVFDREWDIIAFDFGGFVPIEEILDLRARAYESWLSGEGIVFIPTFYAYGTVVG